MSPRLAMTEYGIPLRVKANGEIAYWQEPRSAKNAKNKYRRAMGQRLHRLIVEGRTGIKLPDHAVVHHVNRNDKRTNRGPFVVCEDGAYHQLIEARTRAWEACGNANWKKCRKCGQYDDPANMQSKEYEGPYAPQMKWWHYRFKNQCVDKNFPVKHTRPHTPRKRRHVAPWRENAAQLEQERAEAFRAVLASGGRTIVGADADVCSCGERVAKYIRPHFRYHCVGCGAQKKAGFVGRSKAHSVEISAADD